MDATVYGVIKVLHVLAVISWMAGLLYLPRLLVYHASAEIGSVQSETFKVMERRLYRAIMTPAMVLAWVAGLALAWGGQFLYDHWFWAKLALVLAMSAFHDRLGHWVRTFAQDRNAKAPRFFRFMNEVPTLLMIGIVCLVILKPF